MRSKSLFILALFLLQAFSLISDPLYQIDKARLDDLLFKMDLLKESRADQVGLLEEYVLRFAFSCEQVLALISTCRNEYAKHQSLFVLKDNIIDPENKSIILDSFQTANMKKDATRLIASIYPCETLGLALPQIPVAELPYQDYWKQKDLDILIRMVNKANSSEKKLQIAEDAIDSSSSFLTPEQASLLYESFSTSEDMLALTEFVKDRIVGLTCDQIISILNRFFFQKDKLEALKAFKGSIIDIENKLILLNSFASASMKTEAQKILDVAHAKNALFGAPTGKVVFLLDFSACMTAGFVFNKQKKTRLGFVKQELEKTISSLDSNTRFNIMFYDEDVYPWKADLQNATKDNIIDAIEWTDQYRMKDAVGGSDMSHALQTIWDKADVETIYLVTAAFPSEGETETEELVANVMDLYAKTKIRVNTIAFLMGNSSDEDKPEIRKLMKSIAEAAKGTFRAVESAN